jgi:hypothetical protein
MATLTHGRLGGAQGRLAVGVGLQHERRRRDVCANMHACRLFPHPSFPHMHAAQARRRAKREKEARKAGGARGSPLRRDGAGVSSS